MLAFIYELAKQLLELAKTAPAKPVSRLNDWAKAIQSFEGWTEGTTELLATPQPIAATTRKGQKAVIIGNGIKIGGSISWRQNNPGNLRWSPFEEGNITNFSVFSTYEKGFEALLHQLRIAATGGSKVYRPDMTLLRFFEIYAPSSDNNSPEKYAAFVAKQLGVTVTTPIKNLA
jgi:hypothetical protein